MNIAATPLSQPIPQRIARPAFDGEMCFQDFADDYEECLDALFDYTEARAYGSNDPDDDGYQYNEARLVALRLTTVGIGGQNAEIYYSRDFAIRLYGIDAIRLAESAHEDQINE